MRHPLPTLVPRDTIDGDGPGEVALLGTKLIPTEASPSAVQTWERSVDLFSVQISRVFGMTTMAREREVIELAGSRSRRGCRLTGVEDEELLFRSSDKRKPKSHRGFFQRQARARLGNRNLLIAAHARYLFFSLSCLLA
jgi:hypothetical protein